MSTITSWAGNIADIGPMYPFVGTENTLFVVAVVTWIVWHIIQLLEERSEYADTVSKCSEILDKQYKK